MLRRIGIILTCIMLVASCTPDATPFPVDLPTASSTPPSGSSTTWRYALAVNTKGLVDDLALIQAAAQIEQLTESIKLDDIGVRYDLVAAYGDLQGGTRSPVMPHIALVLNSASAPLDDPILLAILRRSIDTQALVTALAITGAAAAFVEPASPASLRTELANAGWPDGVSLSLGYAYTPGAAEVAAQLQQAGIQARSLALVVGDIEAAFAEGRIQIALITWKTPGERAHWTSAFGDEQVIDLYSLPISYIAAPGLEVEFTPGGWPLPAS